MKNIKCFVSFCFIVMVLTFSSGCKRHTTEPPDSNTKNYVIKPQHNIPWNSLAQTAWPKVLHDAQCTGRSSFNGPVKGQVKATIPLGEYTTDPVMGTDSVFYIVSDTNLYAITLSGTRLWNKYIGRASGSANYNSPIITADGAIIVGAYNGISAFRNDGTLLWNTQLNDHVVLKSGAIDLYGNIYTIGISGTLYAINKSGNILWQRNAPTGYFNWGSQSTISFAPDGSKFYVGGSTAQQSLYVMNTNGDILRTDSLGAQQLGAISVDVDGNVFSFFGNDLVSISSTGKVRWRIEGVGSNWNVTIDPNGNIAYLSRGSLVLVDNNGLKRWSVPVHQLDDITHLVCDANGTIFIETSDDFLNYDVQAVSNTGTVLWTLTVTAYVKDSGPSLTREGYLLFPHSGYYPSSKQMYVIE